MVLFVRLASFSLLVYCSQAWQLPIQRNSYRGAKNSCGLFLASREATESSTVQNIKSSLAKLIEQTDRGRAPNTDRDALEIEFRRLEGQCTLKAPARSLLVEGSWVVDYTTAPPPSNGELGPFKGIAQQEVELKSGAYRNILSVPPNDWLTATLEATWEEWDGVFLQDQDTTSVGVIETESLSKDEREDEDYGAASWVVTFQTLTIRFFGFPLVKQTFENTRRVWRTTYVDEETRVVRASRTGRTEDEMMFYMTRASST